MTVRILLAEDNENLARILAGVIEAQGYGVITAATGRKAARILAAEPVDLLLLDLGLPEIGGIELLQKIRQSSRFVRLPVIIMTGIYKGEQYATAARRLGVSHYLEKPFSRETFTAALAETVATLELSRKQPELIDRLLAIYNRQLSGLLTIDDHSPVAFVKGEPAAFMVKGKRDFPEFLLNRGKISRDDLQSFLANGGERLLFTEAGMLTFDELQTESRLFLTRLLLDNLFKTDGVAFAEGTDLAEPPLLHLSLPRLLYDAVKLLPEPFRAERFTAEHAGRIPARTARFYRRANLINMREADIQLLERINGQRSIAELLADSNDDQSAHLFLKFLYLLGMISLQQAPGSEAAPDIPLKALFNRPFDDDQSAVDLTVDFDDLVEEVADTVSLEVPAVAATQASSVIEQGLEKAICQEHDRIRNKDYYALFDMTAGTFSFELLKTAYFSKAREYSPERLMELSGETAAMAEEIISAYAEAYNTLSNVVAKERYDEMLHENQTLGVDGKQDGQLHARVQFQSGKMFIAMEEFGNAEKALQEAYTLEPDNSAHAAFLAWAIYNNRANRQSKTAMDRARTLIGKSLQLEKTPEAFAFRGWMLFDEGRNELAEGEFLKALKLNPQEQMALNGIRMINGKRESEKKGFLRRFFS